MKKYLPNHFSIDLSFSQLGSQVDDLLEMQKQFKSLKNLKSLKLDTNYNQLCDNDGFQHLCNSIEEIASLVSLDLNLCLNQLDSQHLLIVQKMLNNFPQIKNLRLNLSESSIGENEKDFQVLSQILMKLKNLEQLALELDTINVQENDINFQNLGVVIQKLQNLRKLRISLGYNELGTQEKAQQLKQLIKNLSEVQNLEEFDLALNQNFLCEDYQYLKYLEQLYQKNKGLKRVNLDLSENEFDGEYEEDIQSMINSIVSLENVEDIQVNLSDNQIQFDFLQEICEKVLKKDNGCKFTVKALGCGWGKSDQFQNLDERIQIITQNQFKGFGGFGQF